MIEKGPGFLPSLRDLPKYFGLTTVGYGTTAWLFAITGPFLITLNSAKQGNLSIAETNSWMFGAYFVGGVLTLILALYYRQPVPAASTIPGAVLVGTALTHLQINEVVGAYLITGILITLLGVSGLVKRGMDLLPTPIMMAMVAAVLLPFGLGIINSVAQMPLVSSITFVAFVLVSLIVPVARRFPPVLGAIVVGLVAATLFGQANWQVVPFEIVQPIVFTPVFNLTAALELVIPLTLTVVAIQNAQGIGILQSTGYKPAINAFTIASGIGSIIMGIFGCQSACIAGPMTGIVSSPAVGKPEGRYVAAVIIGVLWIVFGIIMPVATAVSRILPAPLINLLAGLALLGVLVTCFNAAFSGKFRLGALFTFMITISNVIVLNVGAPFWGLVGGLLISLLLERPDFQELAARRTPQARSEASTA